MFAGEAPVEFQMRSIHKIPVPEEKIKEGCSAHFSCGDYRRATMLQMWRKTKEEKSSENHMEFIDAEAATLSRSSGPPITTCLVGLHIIQNPCHKHSS